VGGLAGAGLTWLTGRWWLLAVGAVCIAAAWLYTGGRRPYGYAGLGEAGVFVCFGLVATLGTTFTQAGRITPPAALGAVAVGLIACALLMVNNIRDIPTDVAAGKRTLAVRLGEARARRAYLWLIWTPLALGVACAHWATPSLLVLLLALPAVALSLPVIAGVRGRLLVPVLGGTCLYSLAFGVLLAIGLAA
jgi:1,4-dihydroxy-2-naphthoate octaprenyltransferase